MIDGFVLLAPILLLGVVVLLGLVGCTFHDATAYTPPPSITPPLNPQWGSPAGGDSVTINGTNLSASDAVTFGGAAVVPANVTGSDTQLVVAATPAHSPGAVDVVVTNAGGDSGTAQQAFTYGITSQTTSAKNSTGVKTLTLDPLHGDIIVITVVWHGTATFSFQNPPVPLALINQSDLVIGAQTVHVAVFFTSNVASDVTITGGLSASPVEYALIGSAYDFANANQSFAPNQFNSGQGAGTSASVFLQINDFAPGDLIYAVAVARNVNGGLTGTVSAGNNPPFVPRAMTTPTAYLLVEDHVVLPGETTPPFNTTASTTDPAGSWYIFAMRVRLA
jgi:IPT/TIG domain-containing protein